MLITTGRNPSRECRAIASALSSAVPGSLNYGRGRRSLSSLLSLASKKRYGRICTIYKAEGAVCCISFLSLGSEGEFAWLSPKILVCKVQFSQKAKGEQSSAVSIKGAKAALLRRLLGIRAARGETDSKITAGASKITVECEGQKLLEMGVSYEK